MLGWGIVEQHHLTVGDKGDFLIEICNGRIDINRVVDTAFLIHLPVVQSQLFGEQDDVHILTFLFATVRECISVVPGFLDCCQDIQCLSYILYNMCILMTTQGIIFLTLIFSSIGLNGLTI